MAAKTSRLDRNNIDNWTNIQLRDALKAKGINVPNSMSKNTLKSLYNENKSNSDVPGTTLQNPRERSRSPISTHRPTGSDTSPSTGATSSSEPNIVENTFTECMKTLNSTMSAFSETVKRLQPSEPKEHQQPVHGYSEFPTLRDLYGEASGPQQTGMYENGLDNIRHLAAKSKNGIPASMLSNVDIVSDSLRKQIVDGRNVNLAALLIPEFEPPSAKETKTDSRLKKRLTIEQFRIAFGTYRRVMVATWPHRQNELEAYETDIARIHSFYGERFYDYHLAFASKAAEAVKLRITIDWSKRDTDLFQLILGGTRARQCVHCTSTLHDSEFCNQSSGFGPAYYRPSATGTLARNKSNKDSDKYGRKVMFHNGREVLHSAIGNSLVPKKAGNRTGSITPDW